MKKKKIIIIADIQKDSSDKDKGKGGKKKGEPAKTQAECEKSSRTMQTWRKPGKEKESHERKKKNGTKANISGKAIYKKLFFFLPFLLESEKKKRGKEATLMYKEKANHNKKNSSL